MLCHWGGVGHPSGSAPGSCPDCREVAVLPTHDQLMADLIQHRCAHHPPTSPDVIAAHSEIRNRFNELGQFLNDLLPSVPEKEHALATLDMAMMWANSTVARTQLQESGHYPGT